MKKTTTTAKTKEAPKAVKKSDQTAGLIGDGITAAPGGASTHINTSLPAGHGDGNGTVGG